MQMQIQIKRNKKNILATFALSLLYCSSIAQTTSNPPVPHSDLAIQYLQQDMFLKPGTGFRGIHIGQGFDQVLKIWGKPKKAEKQLFGLKTVWAYNAENGTQMILTGKKTVKTITVVGEPASLYQSVEGARFGMSPNEIAHLYPGPTPLGRMKRLSYPRLGIAFSFKNNSLVAMEVFSPEER